MEVWVSSDPPPKKKVQRASITYECKVLHVMVEEGQMSPFLLHQPTWLSILVATEEGIQSWIMGEGGFT